MMKTSIIIAAISLFCVGCRQPGKQHDKEVRSENRNDMETTAIFPKGSPLSADWFSGDASLFPLVSKDKNNEFSAGSVTFEPGARTNWHTHPKGQVLIVIEGSGFYQERGKPAQPIRKGEVVNIPEEVEHWHGAGADKRMVHIAITNFKDDQQVSWLQPVTEEEYNNAHK